MKPERVEEIRPAAIRSADFERMFPERIDTGLYHTILIFGYTWETATDFLKFQHLHAEDLCFKVLNRNWLREAKDEKEYNILLGKLGRRLWNKSVGIKHNAQTPWLHKAERTVRYYSEHPFVKAILLIGPKHMDGFISFYRWEDPPTDGGSPYKGADLSMIYLPGQTKEELEVLSYLKSQFEHLWKTSLPANQVEKKQNRSSTADYIS
ncbi:MAG: hypothetical protein JOZ48_17770 [Acidobacteriaceae bacterium]|nr:hypothetical protein [Acidobacteriaceae bacterium]